MRLFTMAAVAAMTLATAASAQPYAGGRVGSATLYEFPDFQGRQFTVTSETTNLPRQFNDQARSARFNGRWTVCENADFGGRCMELSGDVPELDSVGLAERISSLRPAGRDGGWGRPDDDWDRPGGGWSGGGRPGGRGIDGARTVFYPYPTIRGSDIAAGSTSANEFCRRNGHGGAAHYDSSERAPRAVDWNGRPIGPSPVLRDLLCRKY
ncbi:beta/gamma crystallin-related protein [Phenylobacterium sp.]|jgi:hypothetical protein|uniref:beta/gamma crystallin-related protein n=1 Tax=Phenylobacterium sp. TaxID=1871053 RepID=UPI002E32EABF|nr:beta/gamma crystallin-related protein [Phenylobacterium sp.]HEX2560972.1 beta/gamma crystallin-related protein [Phenylobacterium sp.]